MTDPSPAVTDGRGWTPRLVWSTVFLALVLEALSLGVVMVSIGLPSILHEFPTTQGGWLLTVYFLTGAVGAPLLGKAADLYGKRRVMVATMFVSGVGALLCAVAPSFGVMIVGRALQGVVVATLSLVPSLIRGVYPPRQAAFATSIAITGIGAFSLVAPLLVGSLIALGGFRGMFWFDVVWTFGLCIAIRFVVPESAVRGGGRPDVVGGTLLAAGVAAVLVYVSMGSTWGWESPLGLVLLLGGLALLVGFFVHARRAPDPIVNLSLFRRKPLLFVTIAGSTGGAVATTISQVLPLFALTPREAGVTYGLGLSTIGYAAIGTPQAIASVAAGVLLGVLVSRGRNPRLFLTVGLVLMAAGMTLLAFRNDSFGEVVVVALVIGLAGGLVNAAEPNLLMRATPAGDQGSTAGAEQLCHTGFTSILPVVMFAILAPYATLMSGGGVVYAEAGLRTWLLIASALALVVVLIGVTLLRERPGEEVREFTVDAPTSPAAPEGTRAATEPSRPSTAEPSGP